MSNVSSERIYVRRRPSDYPMSFKLAVVGEVESGSIGIKTVSRKYGIQGNHTVHDWLKKYGTFDWDNQSNEPMSKTPQQRIMELEQRVRQLEREKECLRQQAMQASDKAEVLDRVIEIVEREYDVPVRKKLFPGQSASTQKKVAKR